MDVNWQPPYAKGLSFDFGARHFGGAAATLDDVAVIPAWSTFDWDTRYQFKMGGENASLKFAVMNIANARSFNAFEAGTYGLTFNSGRRIDLRLIVDLT